MKFYMNFGYSYGAVVCYLYGQRILYTDQETGSRTLRAVVADSLMNLVVFRVISPRKGYLLYKRFRYRRDRQENDRI